MQAMALAQVALQKFPTDTVLQQEHEELLSTFNTELGPVA
jgi:hypothetical protein